MADMVFRLDPEVIVGMDVVNRVGAFCGKYGNKILITTEQGLHEKKLIDRLVEILETAGMETILFDEVQSQASQDEVEDAASLARGARCDMVLGFGGLKTQYTARLAAILGGSQLRLFDILDGKMEEKNFLPYVAIPTAGGDPFLFSDQLIVVDPRDKSPKLIKCPVGLAKLVIMDPSLESLGGKNASTAAFDGLCLSMEAYCSKKASFFSDAVLEQAIALYAKMMHSYVGNQTPDFSSDSVNANFLMSLGASVSAPGIGTALAYALNARFPVAKPWSSTVLLPYVIERLATARPEKIAKAAALMGENVEAASKADTANMLSDLIRRCMGQLSVPARLKDFNLSLDRLVPVAEAARNLEFVSFSPWTVTSEDAYDMLKQAF